MYTLEPKGFTIVDNMTVFYESFECNDASKYNVPVVSETMETYQMITEVFVVENVKCRCNKLKNTTSYQY
jgi:hypothetical protein